MARPSASRSQTGERKDRVRPLASELAATGLPKASVNVGGTASADHGWCSASPHSAAQPNAA
jgi:hypothetical protein